MRDEVVDDVHEILVRDRADERRDEEAKRRYGCTWRELRQFDRARIDAILAIDERAAEKRVVKPRGKTVDDTGFSEKQLRWIAQCVAEGLAETLPSIVANIVQARLAELNIEKRIAKLDDDERLGAGALKIVNAMDQRVRRCENALMPMEGSPFNTSAATADKTLRELRAALDRQTETIASLERRCSRHAEHLRNLETWKQTHE